MSKQLEIVLCGVGGQGLVSGGAIVCEAIVCEENRYATLSTLYGSEVRGTFARSEIVVSDNPIVYPETLRPDIVVTLAQVAYNQYAGSMIQDSILLYDSELVANIIESPAEQYAIPFTKIARNIGSVIAGNMVGIGYANAICGFCSISSLENAIRNTFKENVKICDINIKALHAGFTIY